ncbi:MAG: ABC transporter permease [Candidatus Izemoplasmatales bacterium]|nr:ABC transporter permease [Candidatus Izemoplasmatales bacterium]MDD4069521.1 ABC transporter permease [Candidatus Izemoplasmatales bacterium]MDY0138647.1 methionine ABC transporter permease [Candidatus Izemoplasmatales bacterium]
MLFNLEISEYLKALLDTLYMTILSTVFVFIFGLILGSILYVTDKDGLWENKTIYKTLSIITSSLRSIPFLILIVLLIPFTRIIIGTILGPTAALPALIIGATPFYARLVENSLHEIGKTLQETGLSFGAKKSKVLTKIIIPEALPSLLRGITVTSIAITGYTSIAGAIGAGGLGNLAYLYGYARNKIGVTIIATLLIVLLILLIQLIGDMVVKKITIK